MDFESPRFQGFPRLSQILNQPPGGTVHLQEGDTGADVAAVQKALYDLCWTLTLQPPLHDSSQFVIGTYGPKTATTVLNFRTHFNIIFPGATVATNTVGTATLTKLDNLIVRHDASVAAIRLHASKLSSRGVAVVLDTSVKIAPMPRVIKDSGGVYWAAFTNGIDGGVLHHAATGAYVVFEPIWTSYFDHGFATGPLGFPIWDTYDDEGRWRSDFVSGSLRENLTTGGVDLLPLGADREGPVDGLLDASGDASGDVADDVADAGAETYSED